LRKQRLRELKRPFCLAVTAFLLVLPLLQGASAAEIEWADCTECHSERPRGIQSSFVDMATIESSVHGTLACLDCHSDIHEVKHVIGNTPHQRYAKKVSCTERCHVKGNSVGAPDFSPMDKYKDSAHGLARLAGVEDAATCTDCHGRHNIKPKDDPDSMVYRANIPRTCARCHEDMQVVTKHHIHAEKPFQEYEQSVHGKALYRDGLINVAAVCIDCHGVHDIQAAGTPNLKPRNPETCGKCHISILAVYGQSIHGTAFMEEKNPDAPTCADCHGEHGISVPAEGKITYICSKCHAEETIMAKYEIPVDRAATYSQSFHGVASGYGSKTVANCTSCHGYHAIYPPTDTRSSVNPANLASTCGKPNCHPGISTNVASAKMHVDVTSKESGGVYYVRRVLVWIFIGLLIITFIWFVPDVIRRLGQRNDI